MVNSQFVSSSGRRLFYVSPCTSRYHLSQKALLSDRHEGNVQEREKFSADDGSRCLVQHSSVQWQGYVPVVHHFIKFGSGVGAHTYVVFLSVGGDDGVARSRIAVHFILADHRSGGILRNHKAGVQTGVGNRNSGSPRSPIISWETRRSEIFPNSAKAMARKS